MNKEGGHINYTATEQMVVLAARRIKDEDVLYMGVGLPQLVVSLAKHTHAPNSTAITEWGVIRTALTSPMSPSLNSPQAEAMADSVQGLLFVNAMAQRGFFDVGFVGAGQVDRYGNINSTVAGDYFRPIIRWPGSGGCNDVTSFCKNVIILLNQSKQRFPEKVDFNTAPGYFDGKLGQREENAMLPSTGPSMVITTMGCYTFEDREMTLESIHGDLGITLEKIKAEVGWDIKVAPDLQVTKPPTKEELYALREKVDPNKAFVDGKIAFKREVSKM